MNDGMIPASIGVPKNKCTTPVYSQLQREHQPLNQFFERYSDMSCLFFCKDVEQW